MGYLVEWRAVIILDSGNRFSRSTELTISFTKATAGSSNQYNWYYIGLKRRAIAYQKMFWEMPIIVAKKSFALRVVFALRSTSK